MPIAKRDISQMMEYCRALILRRAVLDLPPKPETIPGFDVEGLYAAHYRTHERERLARMLIEAGLESQVARAGAGAKVLIKTARAGLSAIRDLTFERLPIMGYDLPRGAYSRLNMATQANDKAWHGNMAWDGGTLPRPLLFVLSAGEVESGSGNPYPTSYVNYSGTSEETQYFIQQQYARQYLWLHSMRYYMQQLARLLDTAASWRAVYREVPMLEHVWAAASGRHLKGRRRKGVPNPEYEDLSEMLAGAMLVPDDDKWREHCTL